MQLSQLTEDIALILPLALLVEGIVGVVGWFALGAKGGRGARIAAWLAMVTLTLWCGSALAFVLLHVLLFTLGSTAALLGAGVTTVFMVLMPFAWAAVIRHHGRVDAGSPVETKPGSQPR